MTTSLPVRAARLLALLAVLSTALVVVPRGDAAAETFAVTISPPSGQDAIRFGQRFTVGGSVPAGALESARVVATTASGREVAEDVSFAIGGSGANGEDYLRTSGTAVEGRITLSCTFGPERDCPQAPDDVRRVLLELTVGGTSGRSNEIVVDEIRPRLRGAFLTAPDRIVVLFTEPVRSQPGQTDSAGDWRVTDPDRLVVDVQPARAGDCVGTYEAGEQPRGDTGCTRTLVVTPPLDEDATPTVDYFLFDNRFPGRLPYEDQAGNDFRGLRVADALDRIRPPAPRIDTVAGSAPGDGRVTSRQPAPELTVSNLREGHEVFVRVTPAGGTAFDGPAVRATGTTARVAAPALPADGDYLLQVVARDPAGNLSTETTKTAARSDGAPSAVTYALDTVPPVALGATADLSSVTVRFSEVLARGTDDPADWEVRDAAGTRYPVTGVSPAEDGRARRLTAAGVPAGATVRYAPAASSTRYADAAGNPVADTTVVVGGVPVPTVSEPTGTLVTAARTVTVRGTSRGGTTVEVYRDAGRDGTPDGAPVAQTTVAAGASAYEVSVPLLAQTRNELLVLASDPATGARSRGALVPTVVQDAESPELVLTTPSGNQLYAGGARVSIGYRTCDDNVGSVRIEYAVDGTTFTDVVTQDSPSCDAAGSYAWTVPAVSTDSGRLRLTATDLAGNRQSVLSGVLVVDAVAPRFTSVTRGERTVDVLFSERVQGPVRGTDWTVKGVRAASATSNGSAGSTPGTARDITVITLQLPSTAPAIGPDEEPDVEYSPPPLLGELVDRVGQALLDRRVAARDGIFPAAPVVTAPTSGTTTADAAVTLTGSVQRAVRVLVFDDLGRSLAAVPLAGDGSFSVQVPLRPGARNALRLLGVDGHGNAGPETGHVVVQDDGRPVVTVTAPTAGSRVEPGTDVVIRYSATDDNLLDAPIALLLSTDGGRTFNAFEGGQRNTGAYTWRVPQVRTAQAVVRVTATDRSGRVGSGDSGVFGIGTAAATPSPGPSAGSTATASPSAGPSATAGPTGSASPTASPTATSSSAPGAASSAGTFHPVTPTRLLDTRDGTGGRLGALGRAGSLRLVVEGRAGVPDGALAVVLNVTAVKPTAATHLTVWPAGSARPETSNVNSPRGLTVPGLVTVRVGDGGAVQLYNNAGATHVLADVVGWYAEAGAPAGQGFAPLQPARVMDTRDGTGVARGAIGPGRTVELPVAGHGGVPATGATAVVLNVTAVAPSRASHLTVWGAGGALPGTSNLNYGVGQTVANLVTVPVGRDGRVALRNHAGRVHVAADVVGWYGSAQAGARQVFEPVAPVRLLDTRDGTGARPGRVGAGGTVAFRVAGEGGVPAAGATGVVVTLTAVDPTASTHLTGQPGTGRPTSSLNAPARRNVANLAVLPLGSDGTVRVRNNSGQVHLLADVYGWFRTP